MHYLKPLDGDPLVQITSAYVIDIRDAAFQAHKRRFANYVLAVLRLLLKWGTVRDLVETNQAAAVPKLRRPRNMPPANRPWTDQEYETVVSAASGGIKIAIALGRFTGIPEGDMVRLPRSAYDGNWISWRRGKTGNPVDLPAHPDLKAILDDHSETTRNPGDVPFTSSLQTAWPRTVDEPGHGDAERRRDALPRITGISPAHRQTAPVEAMTIVAGVKGRPYTESGFRAMFFKLLKSLREQGLVGPRLTFQGLRTTAATALAEAGCSTQTIMSVTGHSTEAMVSHYTRQANRKEQAVAAVAKLRPRRK